MIRIVLALIFTFLLINAEAQKYPQLSPSVEVNGRSLINPWAGGSNNPQISTIDLNGDNLKDMFVMERYGSRILPFVAVDDGFRLYYKYSPEYLANFPILYDWALLRDYNNDGIQDIFASSAINQGPFGIEVYKGLSNGKFELVESPGNPHDILYYPGTRGNAVQVYVTWDDIPDINDVDLDGDIDVLSFEPNANILNFYQNMAVERGLGPEGLEFELVDRCWGKFEESEADEAITLSNDPNECANGLIGGNQTRSGIHTGSTTLTFDQDGDGDVEALIGDLTSRRLILLENGGSADAAWMTDQDVTFPSYDIPVEMEVFNASFLFDVNQDGVEDLFVVPNEILAEDINGQWYYVGFEQGGEHLFSLEQSNYFSENMIDLGSGCRPFLVDVNMDGLLDIVAGNDYRFLGETDKQSRLVYFENVGDAENPRFRLENDDYLELSQYSGNQSGSNFTHFAPAFGDLDGDGDVDLLVGTQSGSLIYFENSAGAGMPLAFDRPEFNFFDINPGALAVPAIFDFDNDGLGDILLGNKVNNVDQQGTPCGSFFYFHNTGSVGTAQFDSDIWAGNNDPCFGRRFFLEKGSSVESSPFVYDYNGSPRIYLGTNQGIKVLDGANAVPGTEFDLIDEKFGEVQSDQTLHITLGDLNGDGGLEAIVGHKAGGMTMYKTDHRTDGSVSTRVPQLEGIRLLTNPVETVLEIEGSLEGSLTIIDPYGRIAYSGIFKNQIAVQDWPAGVYVVRVEKDGLQWSAKWVKR